MTKFEGCYLTAAGLALSAKKGINLVFTRAETGSGSYSSSDEARNLTQLKHKEYDQQLEDVQVREETADVIFYVTNKGVTSEYKLTEIGIYANDGSGEEILYCVVFAYEENAEIIYQETAGQITYCQKFCVQTKVSADANVSVQIDGTDHEWTVNYFKKYAGEVNIKKGTLQEQINKSIQELNQAIADAKALRASLSQHGMVKLTESSAVTDSTGLVLAATEKNATIPGTLANQLSQLNTDCQRLHDYKADARFANKFVNITANQDVTVELDFHMANNQPVILIFGFYSNWTYQYTDIYLLSGSYKDTVFVTRLINTTIDNTARPISGGGNLFSSEPAITFLRSSNNNTLAVTINSAYSGNVCIKAIG